MLSDEIQCKLVKALFALTFCAIRCLFLNELQGVVDEIGGFPEQSYQKWRLEH